VAGHVHSAAVSSTPRPHPAAVTRWRTTPTTDQGPKPIFHASSASRRSAWRHARSRCHREQRRQRTHRDARNRRRRRRCRQPLQQVASSVCSLSASSTSVTQPRNTCMLSTPSDSRRKATHALVIYGGGMSGYAKKQGETSGGKCPGGMSVSRWR